GGEPLSVTCTMTRFVLRPSVSAGVHVNTPLWESRFIPAGADSRRKVSVLVGKSASVAVLVSTSVVSSLIVWFAGTVSTGARFASLTTTVKLLLALNGGEPLSVTCTVTRLVLGP